MMSMQPSGGMRSVVARSHRKRQKACTQGARSGLGARSVYSTSSPPRKMTRGLGAGATDTPGFYGQHVRFFQGARAGRS